MTLHTNHAQTTILQTIQTTGTHHTHPMCGSLSTLQTDPTTCIECTHSTHMINHIQCTQNAPHMEYHYIKQRSYTNHTQAHHKNIPGLHTTQIPQGPCHACIHKKHCSYLYCFSCLASFSRSPFSTSCILSSKSQPITYACQVKAWINAA